MLLVGVDVVILFVYTLYEGGEGNLKAEEFISSENPTDLVGVSTTVLVLGNLELLLSMLSS